jgi:hypothetical protein
MDMDHITDPRIGNFAAIGRHYQLLDVIGEGAYGIVWYCLFLPYLHDSPSHAMQLRSSHTISAQSSYQTYHTI